MKYTKESKLVYTNLGFGEEVQAGDRNWKSQTERKCKAMILEINKDRQARRIFQGLSPHAPKFRVGEMRRYQESR